MTDDEKFLTIEEHNTATDEPSIDDWLYEEIFEGEGEIESPKTFPKITMFSQGSTPACTRFGLWLLNNGQNINEYKTAGEEYPEIDPMKPRIRYCNKRGYDNKGSSLQSSMFQARDEGVIEGNVICRTEEEVKSAIDKGWYIYTGSARGRWSGTRKNNGIYLERTDGKFAGHAWFVYAYDDDYVYAQNSYGPNRGPLGGTFKVSRDLFMNKCYTKNAIIDKDDSGKLANFKYKKEIQQAIDNGFFNGKNMDQPLTRNQAAALTTRIIKYLK